MNVGRAVRKPLEVVLVIPVLSLCSRPPILVSMALSAGPKWPFRFLRHRRSWSRPALVWSAGLHAIGFVLIGWSTRSWPQGSGLVQSLHTSRVYALHYFVLTSPETSFDPAPTRVSVDPVPPAVRPSPSATPRQEPAPSADLTARVALSGGPVGPPIVEIKSPPTTSPLEVHELAPGGVAGVGQVIATAASDTSTDHGILGKLGFRVPGPDEVGVRGPDEIGLVGRGLDRVAELISGTGSACPELRPPAAWTHKQLVVAVAFVVDTVGAVDRETLRVVDSPGRPQTEERFQSHVYVVGATVRPDPSRTDPAGYDSIVTHEVASHVAALVFRPALKQGKAVRSTVLISCQTSPG